MKKLLFYGIFAIAILLNTSCSKKGDAGPAGKNGTDGTDGTDGTNGSGSSDDMRLFYFGPDSLTSTIVYKDYPFDSTVTHNLIDSSLILVYYKISNNWYPSPGIGPYFQTDWVIIENGNKQRLQFQIYSLNGNPYTSFPAYFERIKVIMLPSAEYSGHRYTGTFDDYHKTLKSLQMQDD
jgi:hypothetical protein